MNHDFTTRHADLKRFKMNHLHTLAYVRGVPNVFEKEIPCLVRMQYMSCYLSCYLCLIFP